MLKCAGSSFSLLILDLDRFKDINDRFGHAVGDAVLQAFTGTVSDELREVDIFGRTGGEEFLVALPRTDTNQAEMIANRICKAVNHSPIDCEGQKIEYTVSIGIKTINVDSDSDLSQVILHADKAMYTAKSTGRNKFTTYQNPA
jgi:diguanylate cyclase (GGDEF)-like protein